jgi:flagellar hook-associated protein 1
VTLGATLQSALTGLATAQRALGVTANNVANANTEGFVRKTHQQTNLIVAGRGAGVQALDPGRIVDEFLRTEIRLQSGRREANLALSEVHDRLQLALFANSDGGLANSLDRLRQAVEALANAADKLPAKAAVVDAAQDLATEIGKSADFVQSLRRDLDRQIGNEVAGINADLQELADLNREFSSGIPSAELEDRRDMAMDRLAQRLDVKFQVNENGSVSVYTRAGQTLLDHEPRVVHYDPAAVVARGTIFGPIEIYAERQLDPVTGDPLAGEIGTRLVSGGLRTEIPPEYSSYDAITSKIGSGRLQGLLEARDSLLPELDDQLGELTRLLRHTLDAAHNNAVPYPLPNSLTGSRTDHAGFVPGANSGSAYVAVVDRVTGQTLSTITVDPTLGSPAAIAAQLDADLGGYGTATLDGSGRLVISMNDPDHGLALNEGDSAIVVDDAAGHSWSYGFAHYFGLNDFFAPATSSPTTLAVRSDIRSDNNLVANVALSIEAGPPLVGTAGGIGDNRGLQGLAEAFESTTGTVRRGPLPAAPATVDQYLRDIIGISAMQAARAGDDAAAASALAEGLTTRNGEVSGVNLDEELSRLVLYQQSYTVSARIIQITSELFDELLSIAR